jgi:hypothetical protein
MSPLPNPPFPLPSIFQMGMSLTHPQSSTSWLPLRQNASFGPRSPSLHSPLNFHGEGIARTLLERLTSPKSQDRASSTISSMLGPEGELLPASELSPTPSKIDADLA